MNRILKKFKTCFQKTSFETAVLEHAKIYRQVYPIGHIKKPNCITLIFPYGIKLFINSEWDRNEYIESLRKNQVQESELQTIIKILEIDHSNV